MTGKIDIDTIKKITATMGPISIYQFGEFSKYGVNALRLFQYIKTIQGLQKRQNSKHEHWVKVGNVKPYTWFGLAYIPIGLALLFLYSLIFWKIVSNSC